ncbi:MAG: hypothetical protein U9R32_11050 [Bacteroidota bacterium]|nr:hypothetical protein [Bacteroidota bacterium]
MNKKFFLLLVFVAALFYQCAGPEVIFDESVTFENQKWHRFNNLEFETLVDASKKEFDIEFVLKYSEDFQYDMIPIHVILQTPSGEERIREVEINIRYGDGKLIGENFNGIITLKKLLWKEFSFNDKGKVTISIENIFPKIETDNIISAGVLIKECEYTN